MTRTTRQSDRRHDNEPNVTDDNNNNNNNNDNNNDNNNTSNVSPQAKRTRRLLQDSTTADESASEFGAATTMTNAAHDDKGGEIAHEVQAVVPADEDAQLPQFIASLHELISDPATAHVVTWLPLPDGRVHFVVKDVELFTQNILPKYYRTHKMTSFMRQLNNYGFSKVKSTDQNDKTYEFEHESNQLQPNRPDLLFKIERRRAVKRGSPSHGAKRSRPSGQQLFRTVTTVPSSDSHSPHSLSPRGARDFERNVVQAMRVLPGSMRVEATDDDGDESAAASGPAKRRPARSASLAARNAIKAAVQDYDDNGDAAAATGGGGGGAGGGGGGDGGATDESSEFDDTQSASEQQQSPRDSMSQVALAERGRTQLNRLRLHEEQPLSLERMPAGPPLTTLAAGDDGTIGGEPTFMFTVPQAPTLQTAPPSTAFAFRLNNVATAQNQPPQVVVQARVGLTKSGEVWKSMIQSTIVEPSSTATVFDLPRNNSVTDFFGIKREATDVGDLLDTGIADDTRAFLKSSAGIGI